MASTAPNVMGQINGIVTPVRRTRADSVTSPGYSTQTLDFSQIELSKEDLEELGIDELKFYLKQALETFSREQLQANSKTNSEKQRKLESSIKLLREALEEKEKQTKEKEIADALRNDIQQQDVSRSFDLATTTPVRQSDLSRSPFLITTPTVEQRQETKLARQKEMIDKLIVELKGKNEEYDAQKEQLEVVQERCRTLSLKNAQIEGAVKKAENDKLLLENDLEQRKLREEELSRRLTVEKKAHELLKAELEEFRKKQVAVQNEGPRRPKPRIWVSPKKDKQALDMSSSKIKDINDTIDKQTRELLMLRKLQVLMEENQFFRTRYEQVRQRLKQYKAQLKEYAQEIEKKMNDCKTLADETLKTNSVLLETISILRKQVFDQRQVFVRASTHRENGRVQANALPGQSDLSLAAQLSPEAIRTAAEAGTHTTCFGT